MKLHANVVLVATLVSAAAWSQEVNVYGTTMAQIWKDAPGFDRGNFSPGTQYLGIDATDLGTEALSLHMFGWGRTNLTGSTPSDNGAGGDLAFGYLRYRFSQANAEVKAGRFTINQGVGIEQVDGVSARADLRGGFTVSAFGGRPVWYRTTDARSQKDYEFQRDMIAGARIGLRVPKIGEFGLSYLQDGSTSAKDLPKPSGTDYSRKQLGLDIRIAPLQAVDFSGRTVYDLADRETLPGAVKPSRIAEHDYALAVKFAPKLSASASFTERNLETYFTGSNLPSLFRQYEKDKHRATGLNLAYSPTADIAVTADYRHTTRETYGKADRFGADVRWNVTGLKLQSGFGYHKVNADDVLWAGTTVPTNAISHGEFRAWVMYEGARLSASLDGIHVSYDDKRNPQLNGQTSVYELVASAGYKTSEHLKLSGDLSYGANPLFKKDVRALFRAEYRFGVAGKGAKK